MSETNETENKPETLGQFLVQKREARGLSREAFAKEVRIGLQFIKQIEEDDWKAFPVKAYVRSYLNSISTALGLNQNEILARYAKESGGTSSLSNLEDFAGSSMQDDSANSDITSFDTEPKKAKWLPVIILLILLAIVGTLIYVINLPIENANSTPVVQPTAEVKETEEMPEENLQIPEGAEILPADSIPTDSAIRADSLSELQIRQKVDSIAQSKDLPASATLFLSSNSNGEVNPPAATETPVQAVSAKGLTKLDLTGNGKETTWIGVKKDATGNRYLKQGNISSANTHFTVSSQDTLYVIIGNPIALSEMLLNGQKTKVPSIPKSQSGRSLRMKIFKGKIYGDF